MPSSKASPQRGAPLGQSLAEAQAANIGGGRAEARSRQHLQVRVEQQHQLQGGQGAAADSTAGSGEQEQVQGNVSRSRSSQQQHQRRGNGKTRAGSGKIRGSIVERQQASSASCAKGRQDQGQRQGKTRSAQHKGSSWIRNVLAHATSSCLGPIAPLRSLPPCAKPTLTLNPCTAPMHLDIAWCCGRLLALCCPRGSGATVALTVAKAAQRIAQCGLGVGRIAEESEIRQGGLGGEKSGQGKSRFRGGSRGGGG